MSRHDTLQPHVWEDARDACLGSLVIIYPVKTCWMNSYRDSYDDHDEDLSQDAVSQPHGIIQDQFMTLGPWRKCIAAEQPRLQRGGEA